MVKAKARFVKSKTYSCTPANHKLMNAFERKKAKAGLDPWIESYKSRGKPKDVVYYYSRKKLSNKKKGKR